MHSIIVASPFWIPRFSEAVKPRRPNERVLMQQYSAYNSENNDKNKLPTKKSITQKLSIIFAQINMKLLE